MHSRLILASADLFGLQMFGTRTNDGHAITAAWGDPSPEGWYTPTFTVHYDDSLRAAVLDGVRDAVESVEGACHSHSGLMCDRDETRDGQCFLIDRRDVLAAIDSVPRGTDA